MFALWTMIALLAGVADYAFLSALGEAPALAPLLVRPLVEQWIWAALTPVVFALARLVPLAEPHLPRAFVAHCSFFVALSFLHCAIAGALGSPVAGQGVAGSRLWLRFLGSVYSDLWMYSPLVCIRALLDAQRRERERERRTGQLERSLRTTSWSRPDRAGCSSPSTRSTSCAPPPTT